MRGALQALHLLGQSCPLGGTKEEQAGLGGIEALAGGPCEDGHGVEEGLHCGWLPVAKKHLDVIGILDASVAAAGAEL
jgi:hypothetical protein